MAVKNGRIRTLMQQASSSDQYAGFADPDKHDFLFD
jgi:hypothetical protein